MRKLPNLLWLLLLATLVGCGSDTVKVTGKVTLDGEPLTTGRINFYPETGRPATGAIQPDGTFTMTTFEEGDGCLPGEHVVTIKATETTSSGPASFEEELQGGGMPGGETKWLTHPKYSDRNSSPLRASVGEDGGEFTFEVTGP